MIAVRVDIEKCVQSYQKIGGSDEEYMTGKVFFTVSCEGRAAAKSSVHVKQIAGERLSAENIEVGAPVGYAGPWSHATCGPKIANYYVQTVRGLMKIGPKTTAIGIENTFVNHETFTFEAEDGTQAW